MTKKKEGCVFCDVAAGKTDHFQFWQDENHVAFLDKNPTTFGHALVIPRTHVNYVFDLHRQEYLSLFVSAEKIAKVLKNLTKCKRVSLVVTGFEIPHTHVHLIPLNSIAEFGKKIKKPAMGKMETFAVELGKELA